MGFFSQILGGSSKGKTQDTKIEPYYPDTYSQDTFKSVINAEKRYDLRRFSKHEISVIQTVLRTASKKYPTPFHSIGLANESYTIKYKARYVLFDIIIALYEKSQSPIDKMAVAIAYESKGAYFRKQALSYFEESVKEVDKATLNLFPSYSAMVTYLKFADVYEKEHDYKSAITYLKKARASKGASKEYLTEKIQQVEKKLENPPRTRKSKKPDYYDNFERERGQTNLCNR